MSKLFRTIGVGANQQTEEVTNEKIHYYESESDLDTDLANISDDEIIFTQEGNDDRCGIPLGMVVGIMSNVVPQGFLPCNGVAFDENQYPALYVLLGTNVLPNYFDHSRLGEQEVFNVGKGSANAVVAPYDGEIRVGRSNGISYTLSLFVNGVELDKFGCNTNWNGDVRAEVRKGDIIYYESDNATADYSYARWYKHHLYIKATSGLTAEQQDYVLQSLKAIIDGEVIWENPNPTQNYGGTSNVSLITGKKFSDYRKISIECANSAIIYVNVSDFVNYPTYCTSSGNENGWENGSAVIFSRGFRYRSDTSFDVGNCYVGGYTYNNNKIPLRIKGYK